MSQVSILVDAGTGSPVDFSKTTSTQNYRQVVTIGDPNTDANYVNVSNGSMSVALQNSIPAGTNVIGSVGMTGPIPSGSNVIGTISVSSGQIAASNETGTIFNGGTALTPAFGTISFSGLGNNIIVGTIASKRIRVVAMSFLVGTATNVYIKDTAGTELWAGSTNTGQFSANSGVVLPYCPVGYFQTGSGNALMMNISATSSVAGALTYISV